jgi:hypothetical protein
MVKPLLGSSYTWIPTGKVGNRTKPGPACDRAADYPGTRKRAATDEPVATSCGWWRAGESGEERLIPEPLVTVEGSALPDA